MRFLPCYNSYRDPHAPTRAVWKESPSLNVPRPQGEWLADCVPKSVQPKNKPEPARREAIKVACGMQLQDLKKQVDTPETPEVQAAVNALTNVRKELFSGKVTHEAYNSVDFRDHSEFAKHFATLEKVWGQLPPEHTDRRTLEILRIFKNEHDNAKDSPAVHVVWRRVNGSDIFLHEYTHDDAKLFYAQHKESMVGVAKWAAVVAIEGYANGGDRSDLQTRWASIGGVDDVGYSSFLHDTAAVNSAVTFAMLDSRDSSKVKLDNYLGEDSSHQEFPELTPKFLATYFDYLKKVSPALAKTLKNEDGLLVALRNMSSSSQGIFARNYNLESLNIKYTLTGFSKPNADLNLEPTGTELGEIVFTDAAQALKLRQLTQLQHDGKIPKGPIFTLMGAKHIQDLQLYLDDPVRAAETVLQHPQYTLQNEALDAWSFNKSIAHTAIQNMTSNADIPNLQALKTSALSQLSAGQTQFSQFLDQNPIFFEQFKQEFESVNNLEIQKALAEYIKTHNSLTAFDTTRLQKTQGDSLELHFGKLVVGADGKTKLETWSEDFRGGRVPTTEPKPEK